MFVVVVFDCSFFFRVRVFVVVVFDCSFSCTVCYFLEDGCDVCCRGLKVFKLLHLGTFVK